jgi:predicted transcriptional regulator
MPTVKQYKVTPLEFDAGLVQAVMSRRTKGESLTAIGKALSVTPGRAAMAELVASTERVQLLDDPAKLARALVKERKAGKSWGYLAARYGVTETTCRAAFTAATGQPWNTLDYRNGERKEG